MMVAKACFSLLLGLDVLKPRGAVVDLKRSLFAFDKAGGQRASMLPRSVKRYADLSVMSRVLTWWGAGIDDQGNPSSRGSLGRAHSFSGLGSS